MDATPKKRIEEPGCSAAFLTALYNAIKCERFSYTAERLAREARRDWFDHYQIDDICYDLQLYHQPVPRLDGPREKNWTEELLVQARVEETTFYPRPRRIDHEAWGHTGLHAVDMAALLDFLERLGLPVDPAPLMARLLPQIRKLKNLSLSQLFVFWYAKERHKMEPVYLRAADDFEGVARRAEEFKTGTGYKVCACFAGDQVYFLEVHAPKYRYRPEPTSTTCDVCGLTYMKGSPGDSLTHRRRHRPAVAAREALHGIGPCELPLSYRQREALKDPTGKSKVEHVRLAMWSHFARSLDAASYNLKKHPDWPTYARAYLANPWPAGRSGAEVVAELAKEFGGVEANERLPDGKSHWECGRIK